MSQLPALVAADPEVASTAEARAVLDELVEGLAEIRAQFS